MLEFELGFEHGDYLVDWPVRVYVKQKYTTSDSLVSLLSLEHHLGYVLHVSQQGIADAYLCFAVVGQTNRMQVCAK